MECEEKCFTFTWKLENIIYCLQKKGAKISSPAFVVDSINKTKWYLGLYPRGKKDRNYVGFYLYRDFDRQGTERVDIKYNLAFITEDGSAKNGSVLKYCIKHECAFTENFGSGKAQFEKRKDVFVTKRSTFLPQDTLTARCRIWKSDGEMAEDVRCFARTRIGVRKRSFLWDVKNFSTLDSDKKYTYEIKSLAQDEELMSINLSLTEGLDSEEIIRFELSLQDQTIKYSTLRLSLVNASGNRFECYCDEFWFDDGSESKEFKFVFTKNKLMAMKKLYLPNDILSLYWEWTFSEGVVSEKIEDVQYAYSSSGSKFSDTQNVNNEKMTPIFYALSDNLKSLYDENFLCDATLKTSHHTFHAHRIILSASSSVFKAMFSSDMKEKDSNCVYIEDLDDDTISRMLLFLYTTRVEDLTWDSASHLYVAADKYAILSLKKICSSYLKDNLSQSNACEVLLLSDFHADSDLKSAVQNYILENVKDTIKSEGWKLLMETNGKLAAETLCHQYE